MSPTKKNQNNKETKKIVLTYGSNLTHAHDKQHAYMGRGATPKNYVGFVCPKSQMCYSRNEKRQVHYPRIWFANCQEIGE